MPSSYTTSLRLTLPATGELSGQWGNTVNTGITELLDASIAGTAAISTWGGAGIAYTLSNNSGLADEARKMFIVATGSPGEAKNVICPAVSKFYVLRNDTTGGFGLTLKTPSGTGISVPAGQYKFLYCNGTDVVEMFNSAGALTLSGALSVGGTATFAANPTLSAGTANGVLYLNGSKVATSGTALTFDGTKLTVAATADSPTTFFQATNSTTGGNFSLNAAAGATQYAFPSVRGDTVLRAESNSLVFGTAADFKWGTVGAELMRLTSTGLGIGTSSPGTSLQVGNSSGLRQISISGGGYDLTLGASGGTIFGVASQAISTVFNTTAVPLGIGTNASQPLIFGTAGIERMRLDSSGNLGLGVTPSAWGSVVPRAFQIGRGASIAAQSNAAAMHVSANAYYDGSWRYIEGNSQSAARFEISPSGLGGFAWHTAPSGTAGNAISFTQAMTLDASGRLLVGKTATSGDGKLQVIGGNAYDGNFYTVASFKDVDSAAEKGVLLGYNNASNTAIIAAAYGNGSESLAFWTHNNTAWGERARITSGGDFLVNTTGAGGKFYVVSDLTANNGLRVDVPASFTSNSIALISATAAGSGWNFLYGESSGGSSRITIRGDGNIYNANGTYGTISDARLKQDIVDAGSQWADIKAIRFRKYRMKSDVDVDPNAPVLLGVVAQELEQVCPGLVDDGETKSVKSSVLLMKAAVALQEAMTRIEQLEARVAALEAP